MDRSFSETGGARIGWFNATFPFARLNTAVDHLTLKVLLAGTYTFAPNQVVSLERYGLVPYIGWGVRINHTVSKYPVKIVFWCAGNPDNLIRKITGTGFMPAAEPASSRQNPGAAVRPEAFLAAIFLWNALFLFDMKDFSQGKLSPGPFSTLALLLTFITCIGVRRWLPFRKLVMKEGRDPMEISPWLNFLAVFSGIASIIFLIKLLGQ